MKIIVKLLGMLLIFLAIYNIDFGVTNQIISSTLLLLSGVSLLLQDSKSTNSQSLSKWLMRIAGIIAVFFIFKLIFVG